MSKTNGSSCRGPRGDADKERFWRRVLGEFASSGQSVRTFCAARRLAEPSFYHWRRTLARREASAARPAPAATFVPVQLAEVRGRIEIVMDGGHRIRLRGPVDRRDLAEVLAALAGHGSAAAS